jgi:primosomal protein N' (replication factor Y)
MDVVDVATSLPIHKTLSYSWESERLGQPRIGARVRIPVGRRTIDGVVLHTRAVESVDAKLKAVTEVVPHAELPPKLLEFYTWMASYYVYPLGRLIHEAIPNFWGTPPKRAKAPAVYAMGETSHPNHNLTQSQERGVRAITSLLAKCAFSVAAIDGVTGSGKTEIYFHSLQESMRAGKRALLLVPEIALTPQLVSRFHSFFRTQGFVYHSGLTPGQRQWTLWELRERESRGEPFVLIGTRSAVLLPLDFQFIVVDEEHDSSYKQIDHLRYHGRDVAIARGHQFGFPVVLGSATPSMETLQAVEDGRYESIKLLERPGKSLLPSVQVVDLRADQSEHYLLSFTLIEALKENLARKEQSILFLNRRGFAPQLLCVDCGHVFRCPNCDIALTFSKKNSCLRCHYCGLEEARPEVCPTCTQNNLDPLGAGTERIEETLRELFPNARIQRFDRDVVTTTKKLHETLQELHKGEVDILVGTQMVAKGHDFPDVSLVGVLLADSYLHFPDFRACERTFQLLTQVAGRAGRREKPGRVIIQTYQPHHTTIKAVAETDRSLWLDDERALRRQHSYPPYVRLAVLHLHARDESKLTAFARELKLGLPRERVDIECLGPIPSPIARVKNTYRMQLLIKSASSAKLHKVIERLLLPRLEGQSGIDYDIDVDPQHLL